MSGGNPGAVLEARLQTLSPSAVRLEDESRLHRGHPGAKNGAHFRLEITSPKFAGVPPLGRHRMIYGAVGDLAEIGVHALSVRALAPGENSRQSAGTERKKHL